MLSGSAFLSGVLGLLRTYDYPHHSFAPARVSFSETLFAGIGCAAFARIYQLMVRSKSDAISKTQTEIELFHIGFLGSWFCFLFIVHKINLPQRTISSGLLVTSVLTTAIAIWSGFVMRKTLFKKSADALPGNVGEALRRWRGAHFIGFTNAMSIAIWGVVLRFVGSSWYVAGVFFGLSLGFLLLWRPRQLAVSGVQPA